jgi:hypothetical protein
MIELTSKQQDAINAVIENFDVTRVMNAMQATDWRWFINGKLVPLTKPDILMCAREILTIAVQNSVTSSDGKGYCYTGGLEAACKDDFLTLKFVLPTGEFDIKSVNDISAKSNESATEDYESIVKQYAKP